MAQLKRSSESPQMARLQTSPTFEQLLRVDEVSWSTNSASPGSGNHHDQEGNLSPNNNRKSVLSKVKETAKKLRHTLSGRRKHGNDMGDGNHTPPWGVSLDDYDDDDDYEDEIDDDPEYLGAPMYESEAAPETLKETARQHPRADPVVSEKHKVPNREQRENDEHLSPNTAVAEKLGPAYAAMSDATHKIASKIAGLSITTPEPEKTSQSGSHKPGYDRSVSENSSNLKQYGSGGSPQTWDKGVSVKEYFMNKLEPGEDERALSQAITEAISPTKTAATGDSGVVEKVKDAVTSFFRHEDHSSNTVAKSKSFSPSSITQSRIPHIKANSSPIIAVSSSSHEVVEEGNHGKILQAN